MATGEDQPDAGPDPRLAHPHQAGLAWLGEQVRERVTVDTRALAALRIALGLILIVDLVHRAGRLELFYTDAGVYPRSAYASTYSLFTGLSLHALSGQLWFQQLLFVVAGLFALAFALGYRTRITGLVSFALLVSLQARNPALLNGGDRLLRVVLLVSLVAPLGERWSIDAWRTRSPARETVASFGTAAVLAQPLAVFTTNAIQKHGGDHWFAGDALQIAMSNDAMTVYLGNVLADHAALLTVLNYNWVALVSGSIVLLGLTVGRARALAALVYISAFAGMGATMAVGLFPLALTAAVLAYLTPPFWGALAEHVPTDRCSRLRRWADRLPGGPPLEERLLARLDADPASRIRRFGRVSLHACGLIVLTWIVVFSATHVAGVAMPAPLDNDHLDQQQWGLYAPDPTESYGWFVVQATRADGSTFDALNGGTVTFQHPQDAAATYDTFRHRKFMESVRSSARDEPGTLALAYADWACRQAQQLADEPVAAITAYKMHQPSPIDGEREEPARIGIIDRDCSAA
jgi:hypothetical protein